MIKFPFHSFFYFICFFIVAFTLVLIYKDDQKREQRHFQMIFSENFFGETL